MKVEEQPARDVVGFKDEEEAAAAMQEQKMLIKADPSKSPFITKFT